MDTSPNLGLPYIASAQAQKHVTHNEAIRALDALVQLAVLRNDLATAPTNAADGDRYIVASAATGDWAGNEGNIAAFQDNAWIFYTPETGWRAWVESSSSLVVWAGSQWVGAGGGSGSTNPTPLVGVNATADATNRLSVSSAASLLNHEGNGHQLKINKNASTDTASLLFQTGFSGRAEFGTTGDDDFHVKVSPDGSTFHDALLIDKDTGEVSFPNSSLGGGGFSGSIDRINYIRPEDDATWQTVQQFLRGAGTAGISTQSLGDGSGGVSGLRFVEDASGDTIMELGADGSLDFKGRIGRQGVPYLPIVSAALFTFGADYTRTSTTRGDLSDALEVTPKFGFDQSRTSELFFSSSVRGVVENTTTGNDDCRADISCDYLRDSDATYQRVPGTNFFNAGQINIGQTVVGEMYWAGPACGSLESTAAFENAGKWHARIRGEVGYSGDSVTMQQWSGFYFELETTA